MGPPWIKKKPDWVRSTRVLVCGSRTFNDYELLISKLDVLTFWFDDVEVTHGGDRHKMYVRGGYTYCGADYFAGLWAERNWYTQQVFYPDWDTHGKGAGPLRNTEMVQYVGPKGYCVAFWDGFSPGTADTIRKAHKYLKESRIKVIKFKPRKQ